MTLFHFLPRMISLSPGQQSSGHAPDFDEASLEFKISKKNTYLSLTCTIRAISRAQLDALYQELCDHPMVVMVL
jgi:putative lipoic acid-binding regulatory protein